MLIDCPKTFQESPILQCSYNAIDVMGHFIVLEPYGYGIKIDSPFSEYSTSSSYVPLFARGGFKHYITDGGTISEHCISNAKQTLQELYRRLVFFEQNSDTINKYYSEIKKALEVHEQYSNSITHDEFLKLRIELRQERKDGLIDNIQYQKGLAKLTKKKDKTQPSIFILNIFVGAYFRPYKSTEY